MFGFIDGVNFSELEAQRYWSFPSSYSQERKREEIHTMIFGGNYLGSRKMDGALARFVKDEDGNMMLLSRSRAVNGEFPNKIGHVPHLHDFFENLPNGTCLLGELYFPNNEGSRHVTTIMGCLEEKAIARQASGDKLCYYVFDVLAWNGESLLKTNIEERVTYLYDIDVIRNTNYNEYIHIAQYFEGEDLWNKLQSILAAGGEGIVITKCGTCYQPGKRPARQTLKIKKELQMDIDAFIIGANPPTRMYTGKDLPNWEYYVNVKTDERLPIGNYYKMYLDGEPIEPVSKNYYFNRPGSLQLGLMNGDKVHYLGDVSGITDEIKDNWREYIGRCCQITGMELSEGHIRHPKFVCWRDDKNREDCTVEQIQ